ncbi:MAG: hypothetical protein HQK83_11665 [Fibrobacteria bacterium]|nr:hypothetical protein [Fibrobacteria bacterium]
MQQNFKHLYKKLYDKPVQENEDLNPINPPDVFLAELLDDRHAVILNVLLDEAKGLLDESDESSFFHFEIADKIFQVAEDDIEKILIESEKRFTDFLFTWRSRLSFPVLFPLLKSNRWFEETDGLFRVVGTGTKDEARSLYQQSLQDMTVEGLRIYSLVTSSLFGTQEKLVNNWHRYTVSDNMSKMLPVFEEALRRKEIEMIKGLKQVLSNKVQELFLREMNNWSDRTYTSEQELFNNMIWPWYTRLNCKNGFEGFMLFFTSFIQELLIAISKFYENKWRFLFRQLSRQETPEI